MGANINSHVASGQDFIYVTGNTAQMMPKAIYIGKRAAKTLDQEQCVQISTAEGQLCLSQIKTL